MPKAVRMIGRVNGHGPALVVPAFVGVPTDAWSDLPPAAYPLPVIAQVIQPRLGAGEDLIRLNAYQCPACNRVTITIDRHPGVTPAFVDHARFDPDTRCPGMTASLNYPPDIPRDTVASHEWYRPSEDELVLVGNDQVVNHVMHGGLLLRPIPLAEQGPQ